MWLHYRLGPFLGNVSIPNSIGNIRRVVEEQSMVFKMV